MADTLRSVDVPTVHGMVVLNPNGTSVGSGGVYSATPPTLTDGQRGDTQMDVNANTKVTLATSLAGEDLANDVLKVEQRFTPSGAITSDTLVKTGVGFLHSITIAQADAAPTAGTITILDNTVAGSGTQLFSWNLTTAVFIPFTVIIDASFSVGLFADFTTTADVNIFLSYR